MLISHRLLWLHKVIAAPFLFWWGPIRQKNKPNLGSQGVLVLANHLSDCDPVVTQWASPRPLYFMGKAELFEMPFVGTFMRWWGSFSVKRGEPDRKALQLAIDLLKAGNAVCIYPEGQLSESGELQPLKPGIALIVRRAGVPVVCCGLKGTQGIIPYGERVPRKAKQPVSMEWSEPHLFNKEASAEDILSWAEATLKRLTAG
jgi:1-acyl-sn-glycerol-3-phosphate acyltransferase